MFRIYTYQLNPVNCFDEQFYERALCLVPEKRKNYIRQLGSDSRKNESLVCYLMLAHGLEEDFGIDEWPDLAVGEDGRPQMTLTQEPNLHFCFSHSHGLCAVVISDLPCGIDCQKKFPEKVQLHEKIASRYKESGAYQKIAERTDPETAFIRYFALRESLKKMNGKSLF